MDEARKARAVGINHIALEVGDIDEALEFYGKFLEFTLRGKGDTMAFIDLGDQFIALSKVDDKPRAFAFGADRAADDDHRHAEDGRHGVGGG